ncbi:MAG: hypothetical protein QXR19_18495, partial [Candidatus Jordarchaeaceae archaeon]
MVIFLVLLVGVLGCFQRLGTNAEKGQPQKFYLRAINFFPSFDASSTQCLVVLLCEFPQHLMVTPPT